jgi:hypothetical protein
MWDNRGSSVFWWGNLTERDHLEDPSADGSTIFKIDFQKVGCRVLDWTDLAPDRDRWQALVNSVINLQVP